MQKQTQTKNLGKCHAGALEKTLGIKFTLRNRKVNPKQNSLLINRKEKTPEPNNHPQ